ncbi:MAG: ribosome biogenesis GTPase YlqF [Peptococcaceae bacterium]|jgi:ribosome biogenesis GTPase A|nr:ribosome biogenesis GTPase YlqF [Peptococcaceae bacterium]
MDIQWYPGHMAKAKRLVKENLKLVDVVIELLDARIPSSSRNPEIDDLAGQKPRLVILNKSDLADPEQTKLWKAYFAKSGIPAIAVDSIKGKGVREVPEQVNKLAMPKIQALVASGRRPRAPRCMVLGIPNVGKSLFINKLVGQHVARTGDKPGVTRGQQWIRLAGNIDLLDTPGILWPKFESQEAAYRLAITGAIKDETYDFIGVAGKLLKWLADNYPENIRERYKIDDMGALPEQLLEAVGARRGFYLSGGAIDSLKAARVVIKEFREGKLGRYTLDRPKL